MLISSQRIPVLVITGYLGAGKTTFLNHLLASEFAQKQNIALIINEFGPLGVDGALVNKGTHPLYEVNRGSLFCACTKMELWKILQDLLATPPDLLIIEATGVAIPTEFTRLLESPFLADSFYVQSIVALVDARNFLTVAPYMQAVRRQIMTADGMIINKTDLADSATLEHLPEVLKDLNARAPQIAVKRGSVPVKWVESLSHTSVDNLPADAPPKSICAISLETDCVVDKNRFEQQLQAHAGHILRLKGTVDFGDGLKFIEQVGNDVTITEKIPDKELSDKGKTAICIIARKVAKEKLKEDFQSCF